MKTLSEYNTEYNVKRFWLSYDENAIGIACDHCGHELAGEKSMLLSNPPQQNIRCPSCDWRGRRYV